jgi:hypothetical protein
MIESARSNPAPFASASALGSLGALPAAAASFLPQGARRFHCRCHRGWPYHCSPRAPSPSPPPTLPSEARPNKGSWVLGAGGEWPECQRPQRVSVDGGRKEIRVCASTSPSRYAAGPATSSRASAKDPGPTSSTDMRCGSVRD